MKIWVDDIRTPPDDTWVWCKTSNEAINVMRAQFAVVGIVTRLFDNKPVETIDILSLDHDLGGDDTTRPILLWLIEEIPFNTGWPKEIKVHSANPVGREWLEAMIERYGPHD